MPGVRGVLILLLFVAVQVRGAWSSPGGSAVARAAPEALVRANSEVLLADMREEKDRIIYSTIPPGEDDDNAREEKEKQDKAWEMLMNLPGPGYYYGPRDFRTPPDDPTRQAPSRRFR